MRTAATAALALAGAIALAACQREPAPPAPAPSASPSATPTADATKVSIIRPDIEVERDAAEPMTPLALTLSFPEGTALTPAAVAALTQALAAPQMAAGGAIAIRGHSDAGGSDEANLRVSQRRAEAVRDWLAGQGVAPERMTVIAFGEQNPVAPNALPDGTPDEAGRAKNRRVDLAVAVPPGTPPADAASESGTLVEDLTAKD